MTAARGRRRRGISVHEGSIVDAERTRLAHIPVTSAARTLFDLAEVIDGKQLERAFEQADRMRVLRIGELESVCERGHGRRALWPVRRLLEDAVADVPPLERPYGCISDGTSGERGQATVEWVGVVAVVALVFVALVGLGVRVPGTELARAVASRMLCAVALADRCGDEPALIAAYGTEVGKLVRRHMPTMLFERGSRALPVDFRRCRRSACADGSARGLVHQSDVGLPVTAFAHVVDCRGDAAETSEVAGVNCSGPRTGNLYLQYWTYYVDSATLRGVPVAGPAGYHRDDWESTQIRISPDGSVDQRASSHHGYNHVQGLANAASDAGLIPLRDAAEAVGARPHNGWGPETRLLLVSGGSHAGNANGFPRIDRITPGRRVHLVPLEPIAAEEGGGYRFAVSPPWLKRVWRDPEASGTD